VSFATRRSEFAALLHRHGAVLARVRGSRGVIPCLFHEDRHPSLSIDLDRGLFNCFTCGAQGGLRRFAELTGEQQGIRPLAPRRRLVRALEDYRPGVSMWPVADEVRYRARAARALRAYVTRRGPNGPGIWLMLCHAARLERESLIVETALGDLLAEGRLP